MGGLVIAATATRALWTWVVPPRFAPPVGIHARVQMYFVGSHEAQESRYSQWASVPSNGSCLP